MSRLFVIRFSFSGNLASGYGGAAIDIYFKKTGYVEDTGVWSLKSLGRTPTEGYFDYSSKDKSLWASRQPAGIVGAAKCFFTFDLAKDCSNYGAGSDFNLRGFAYPCKVGDNGYGGIHSLLFGLSAYSSGFKWEVVA